MPHISWDASEVPNLGNSTGIKAARAATFHCLSRLDVDHAGREDRTASAPLAGGRYKSVVDPLNSLGCGPDRTKSSIAERLNTDSEGLPVRQQRPGCSENNFDIPPKRPLINI